jgi:hypothetical protein
VLPKAKTAQPMGEFEWVKSLGVVFRGERVIFV